MMSRFLTFTMHKKAGNALIKPGEITSICPAPEGGSRIVTHQKQIFYVEEEVQDVDRMILEFFEKLELDRNY